MASSRCASAAAWGRPACSKSFTDLNNEPQSPRSKTARTTVQCCFAGVESGGSRKDCAYRNVWAIIQSGMHYVGFAELASVVSGGLRIITGLTQKRRTHRARGADASRFSQLAARVPPAACCRAAEQGDELAPPHSITSSASVSRLSEILRPSALAVVKIGR